MDKLLVERSMHLKGEIVISGAKNAALPIICAGLLSNNGINLTNVPHLRDIDTLGKLLSNMGVKVDFTGHNMYIDASKLTNLVAEYELVKQMRASILVLGPLLARFGEAKVSLPGGCAIGERPVDIHLSGLKKMGAEIEISHGYIHAKANKLFGANIIMDKITVTGTENLLMAAVLAEGTTILENCAQEPEVTDLALCLSSMGADIQGIGTATLVINGVKNLHSTTHNIIPDRIEAGTYAVAAAMTQSDIILTNMRCDIMEAIILQLRLSGALIDCTNTTLRINMQQQPNAVSLKTAPYPDFPTDMQAQFMALNCIARGNSVVEETIFENRFMHIPELRRMGAFIQTNGNIATIQGNKKLTGASVMATDLRASASLVLAGMVASGTTSVDRVYHLDRGYENMEVKLNNIGAKIKRISY